MAKWQAGKPYGSRRGLGAIVEAELARIPLRRRDGTVRAWAILDAADVALLDDRAFSLSAQGYAVRNVPGASARERQLLHRVLLDLKPGDKREADHKNRNRLNNRRCNLRVVNREQQRQNSSRPTGTRRGRSRFRNVYYHSDPGRRKRWQAAIRRGPRYISLGYYETEEKAGAIAAAWRREHLPFATE